MDWYWAHREELVRDHLDKFITLTGNGVQGTFDTFTAALEFGLERFGLGEFALKEVLDPEPAVFI